MVMKAHDPRPSTEDVARRLVILKYVVVYALTAPPRDMLRALFDEWSADDRREFAVDAETQREEFWQPLHEEGLWPYVSRAERELASTTMVTMAPQQQINASWRVEAAQILMWALGLISDFPPYDKRADHDLLKLIPSGDVSRFASLGHLRKVSEIDRARSDAELWHWRSRTRKLIEEGREFPADEQSRAAGFNSFDDVVRFTARTLAEEGRLRDCIDADFPVKGKAYRQLSAEEWAEVRSITMERHFALNWLCGYAPGNEWDKTPTDT